MKTDYSLYAFCHCTNLAFLWFLAAFSYYRWQHNSDGEYLFKCETKCSQCRSLQSQQRGRGQKCDLPKFLKVFVFLACDWFTVLEMIIEINVIPERSVMGPPNVSHWFSSTGKIIIALLIVKVLSLTPWEELVLTYWESNGIINCGLFSSWGNSLFLGCHRCRRGASMLKGLNVLFL